MTVFIPATTVQFEIATLIVAIISGIAIPVIIFLALRYRSARAALESKKELTEKELSALVTHTISEKIGDQNLKVDELTADLKTFFKEDQATKQELRERIEKLSRDHLKQLIDCQSRFISHETYERDASVQKHYMKVIYGTIKKHSDILEAEISSISEEDDD
jgi:hypothetical protein